jgi:hypothetical protein
VPLFQPTQGDLPRPRSSLASAPLVSATTGIRDVLLATLASRIGEYFLAPMTLGSPAQRTTPLTSWDAFANFLASLRQFIGRPDAFVRLERPHLAEQQRKDTEFAAPSSAGALLERIRITASADPDDGVELIYTEIDACLRAGWFAQVDALLEMVKPSTLEVLHLLALVSITYAAREHVPARARFVARVRQHLVDVEPARAEELLAGFE